MSREVLRTRAMFTRGAGLLLILFLLLFFKPTYGPVTNARPQVVMRSQIAEKFQTQIQVANYNVGNLLSPIDGFVDRITVDLEINLTSCIHRGACPSAHLYVRRPQQVAAVLMQTYESVCMYVNGEQDSRYSTYITALDMPTAQ
ncbi:hypothetical protein F4810DRAFT_419522 [Camillea tinctor]|nr:hypothetical protein F4810DRAFT_419522 [Camillea tinctor]